MQKKMFHCALLFFLSAQDPAFYQLGGANDSGVLIGHIHLFSKDPDAQKKIWVEAFDAQPAKTGTLEILRLPGVFIIINKGEPSGGSVGTTADHVGFSVKSLDGIKSKLASMNIQMDGPFVSMPDG